MAKNTGSNLFRKINVDDVSDKLFQEETIDETDNAPINTKDQAAKDAALRLMMKIIASFKTTQIDEAVQTLDIDELDLLMKYVYRGFDAPGESSHVLLLTWHEKQGKLGCIIRCLTDKKRI